MRRKKSYFQQNAGDPAPLIQEVTRRVAFSEVDAMAVVWHGNYLRFFEAAHTELMHRIGLGFAEYARERIAAPMVQAHVDYHAPLMLDEAFTVRAELYWNDGARLDIAYTITGEDGRVRVTGYTVQMFCGLDDHIPCIFPPPVVARMRERWQNGELYQG